MSEKQAEAQLTLKDRLNFPYILANQILTFQKAILNLEYSDKMIRKAIEGFVVSIPDDWADDEFKEDIEKATVVKKIDKRPLVAGNIRMNKETCEALGIKAFEEETVVDEDKLFHACINLLNRRKMLSKVNPVEEISFVELEKIGEAQASEIGKDSLQSE